MDAATSSPHFLTLPREIRNQIYSYLHRTLELRGIERIGPSQVFVRLENVPYPSIYCVHSRLHDEYHESGPIKSLSALIFNRPRGDDKKFWSENAEVVSKDETTLTLIKSVTLRMSITEMMQETITTELVNALSLKAGELRIVRVNEITPAHVSYNNPLPEHADWSLWDYIHPLPHVLASLPRIQLIN